jgi:serine/threonine-protein kinase
LSDDVLDRLTAALADRYGIERELGRGGMATVYLAHDLKHDRKVAVKVLHPELAAVLGAERFLNEIKVTANLQHPHILPLHDSGEAEGFVYYVMPYVEGESLRDKLEREKELSIDETIEITKAVASALDYAHRQEVIHRDIKPENILLHDGQPVVADFGIALAVSAAGGSRLTETGLSLGTPQYMSPEQAMGDRVLDGRSDVYSLGCVVYEMLVGEPPYTGPTAQAVIAKIVTDRPRPVRELRDTVPASAEAAVYTALAKLPADRFDSAGAFASGLADEATLPVTARALRASRRSADRRARLVILAGWGAAALVALVAWMIWPPASTGPEITITTIPPPPGHEFVGLASLALAPDGSRLAFAATSSDGSQQLWLRELDELNAVPLPNTEDGNWPFWSPDGQTLGFFANGRLWKLDLETGTPRDLCAVPVGGGGAWSTSGDIVYSSGGNLWRASPAGGDCTSLYTDTSSLDFLPTFLPDGNHFLFTRMTSSTVAFGGVMIGGLDRSTLRTIQSGYRDPRFVPPNRVLYGFDQKEKTPVNQILATTMDMRTLAVADDPNVVASVILAEAGVLSYTVSQNGTLAYLTGYMDLPPLELDRAGQPLADLRDEPLGVWGWGVGRERPWLFLASEDRGLYLYDWRTGATPDPLNTQGLLPVAGPGDTLVAFLNWRAGTPGCSVGVLNVNRGQVDTIIAGPPCLYPTDWSLDGRELLLSDGLLWLNPGIRTPAIWTYSFTDGVLQPTVQESGATARHGTYSPDGRWIAFTSDRSAGRFEVHVQPRDGSSRPVQISRNGGAWPRWRNDSRELYFIAPDGGVYAARMPGDSLPTPLFFIRGWTGLGIGDLVGTMFDVTPDGSRFFVTHKAIEPRHLVVVQNWMQQ